MVWGHPGTTLVPSHTHRPPRKSHFQSGKLIQITFLRPSLRVAVFGFGCWILKAGCFAALHVSRFTANTPCPPCRAAPSRLRRASPRSFLPPGAPAGCETCGGVGERQVRLSGLAEVGKHLEAVPDTSTTSKNGGLGSLADSARTWRSACPRAFTIASSKASVPRTVWRLRGEYPRTIEPARALAAETLFA